MMSGGLAGARWTGMLEPEYRVGFRVLSRHIGLLGCLRVVVPAAVRSLLVSYPTGGDGDGAEHAKARIKDHFKLLALLYGQLHKRYGKERTNEIMRDVLMTGGQVFFRGFSPLGRGDDLRDFARIYREFESHNIVFDVIEESEAKFEITIGRCLIYEAFNELGVADLTRWMCDIAFEYFSHYDPRMQYQKDRMIARGDDTCHEVFTWEAAGE